MFRDAAHGSSAGLGLGRRRHSPCSPCSPQARSARLHNQEPGARSQDSSKCQPSRKSGWEAWPAVGMDARASGFLISRAGAIDFSQRRHSMLRPLQSSQPVLAVKPTRFGMAAALHAPTPMIGGVAACISPLPACNAALTNTDSKRRLGLAADYIRTRGVAVCVSGRRSCGSVC
jgi:hypothetical protein